MSEIFTVEELLLILIGLFILLLGLIIINIQVIRKTPTLDEREDIKKLFNILVKESYALISRYTEDRIFSLDKKYTQNSLNQEELIEKQSEMILSLEKELRERDAIISRKNRQLARLKK